MFFDFCEYKRARCLAMMAVIIIFIHIHKSFFYKKNLYKQIAKKSILFTYGIPRALFNNKIAFFAFFQKFNNSIAIKMCVF